MLFSILFSVTEKEHYEAVVQTAEQFLSPAETAVLKLGLSLRIYSARVEMFSQMAQNKNASHLGCDILLDVGGRFTCSLEDVDRFIDEVLKINLYQRITLKKIQK